jgi:hypothetical protein
LSGGIGTSHDQIKNAKWSLFSIAAASTGFSVGDLLINSMSHFDRSN